MDTQSNGNNPSVEQVLQNPGFRRSLQETINSIRDGTGSGPTRSHRISTPSSSTSAELNRTFRRRNSPFTRRPLSPKYFYQEVILLRCAKTENTLNGVGKAAACRQGRVIYVKFNNSWTYCEMMGHLRTEFDKFLGEENVDLEIMLPVGRMLVNPPTVSNNDRMSAMMLRKIFKLKPVYLRPSRSIETTTSPELDSDSTDEAPSSEALPDQFVIDDIEDDVLFLPSTSSGGFTSGGVDASSSSLCADIEDLEFRQAIDNSLSENHSRLNTCEERGPAVENIIAENHNDDPSAKDVIDSIRSIHVIDQSTPFYVTREDVFYGACLTMRRPSFNPLKGVYAKFSGEVAIDSGGPTREFFRLVVKEIAGSYMFEGHECSKHITMRLDALQANEYFTAGCLMAMSLLHGGPGPGFFSKKFFQLFIGNGEKIDFEVEDINDDDIKSDIINLLNATNVPEMNKVISESIILQTAGVPIFQHNCDNKDGLVKGAINFYLNHRLEQSLQQLKDGFKATKMYDPIVAHPELFEEIFCNVPKKLAPEDFMEMFHINHISHVGSNQRRLENKILSFFNHFLIDCYEKLIDCTIEDVFVFGTGASHVPPLGFIEVPTITFCEGVLATANTCSLTLRLPLSHTIYETFQEKLLLSFKDCNDFGCE